MDRMGVLNRQSLKSFRYRFHLLIKWKYFIAAASQYLDPVRGYQYGMLPLRGKTMVLGDHRPVIREYFQMTHACINHGLDSEGHARLKHQPRTGGAIMQHLRLFMEDPADTVAAKFTYDRKIMFFRMLLYDKPDIPQPYTRPDELDTL